MTKETILTTSTFSHLVSDLQKIIKQGRDRAKSAANLELIRTYWAIGRRIELEGLTKNAGYGDAIMERLAEALDVDRSTLIRSVQFYMAYPKGSPEGILTWSHYRLLLTVDDPRNRKELQETAEKEGWTRQRLSKAIKAGNDPSHTPGGKKDLLKRPNGGPFIYRAEVLRVIDGDTLLLMLCGQFLAPVY